jgi:hypothetical protein
MPTKEDWKRMTPSILRGTVIGSALGILPGSGSILGAFAADSGQISAANMCNAIREEVPMQIDANIAAVERHRHRSQVLRAVSLR